MQRILIFTIITFVWICTFAQDKYETYWKEGVIKVRVISYNIFNGFDNGKDTDREDRFVKWIVEKDPEIMMLQELCGFTQAKLEKLARKWGHNYATIVKENGYPVGITSKKPLNIKAKLVKGYGHGLLHVETYGLNILTTHLNPNDTDKRREEAHNVIKYIRDNNLSNVVLAGDMNSHSPFDLDYLENISTELTAKYGGKTSKNLLNGKIDYSVIATYLSYPLIDACALYTTLEQRFSYPTPILYSITKNRIIRAKTNERLDYIFVTPDMRNKVVDGFIWNGEETEYLSDHFPVAIDLMLTKQDLQK